MAQGSDDYYAELGVARSATEAEIKKAYLRLARELHPDASGGDPANEERFKRVTRAYETLRDPERRRQYDLFGAEGPRGSAGGDPFGGSGLGDIFDAFFGGGGPFGAAGGGRARAVPRQGEDAEAVIDLDFAEAVFGAEQEMTIRALARCGTCAGTGARPGTTPVTCTVCHGAGEVRRVRQSILGQMVTAGPCPQCGGLGEEIPSKCPECAGQGRVRAESSFVVDVPAGVDTGTTLRLPGRGAAGLRGGPSGDLYVHVRVRPHPTLVRKESDLLAELHVPMTVAALGGGCQLETLDGVEAVSIAAGTQTGKQVRLRGRGVPRLGGGGRGDLIATVVVDTPTDLTKAQDELLRLLAAERAEAVGPVDAGLMGRIKGAFK
ncbi:MAG TPA: J domain-containing protein [Acidimicrobiales bacterium]|nr:J domain-containing protein [Acidimicrobiales bacterium]